MRAKTAARSRSAATEPVSITSGPNASPAILAASELFSAVEELVDLAVGVLEAAA